VSPLPGGRWSSSRAARVTRPSENRSGEYSSYSNAGSAARARAPFAGRPSIVLAPLALALTLFASNVVQAGDLRVLIVGPSPAHPTVVRVRQELLLLGLDVEIASPGADGDLAALASDRDAAAVARVQESPPEIVLWVDAAHSGGAPALTRVSESVTGSPDAGLLALRAVELLRGRLIPVAAPKADASATPTASPSATATLAVPTAPASAAPGAPAASPTAPGTSREPPFGPGPGLRPTRARIHVGPAIVVSPGGVPVAPGLRVGGGWRVLPHLELEGLALVPLTPGTVSAAEGQMDLRMLAFGVGASAAFLAPSSPFALHAGGGIGVAGLFFEGNAQAPWLSASGSRWAVMPHLGAGAAYRFTSVLALRADALASFVLPEAVLVIAGNEVASFGLPAMTVSLSLEVHP
jgi:hypothetical protein